MKVDTFAQVIDQANNELSKIVARFRVLSETVTDRCKETYHHTERGVRKLRITAEEGIADTRRQIKSHPLASVVVAASGAFLLGRLAEGLSKRRSTLIPEHDKFSYASEFRWLRDDAHRSSWLSATGRLWRKE